MTVKISKPALNLREELASLRNQGGLPKEDKLYLDDLVTNGDFSNGTTGWSEIEVGSGTADFTVTSGALHINLGGSYDSGVGQQFTTEIGKTYKLSFDITFVTNFNNSNNVQYSIGTSLNNTNIAQSSLSSNGTYTLTFTARHPAAWVNIRSASSSNTTGEYSLDNISVQEVGENLVTNGTFDTDSQWNKGVGWTISGGKASSDGSQTAGSSLTLNNASKYETGKTYTVTFTISNYSAGGVNPHIRGDAFGEVSGNGTHTVTGVAGSSSPTGINMYASSTFVGSIDNVIVTEGSHHVIQIIPNGYDVKDVYINGELAREGEAYDYQVQTDGINQWLKPTVEPTATTETVVIGVRK